MTPLFVELFGLPGAGKSTLAAAVLQALAPAGDGVDVGALRERPALASDVPGRALQVASLTRRFPRVALAAAAFTPHDRAAPERVRGLLARVAAVRAVSGLDVVLQDEGLVQGIWSLGLGRSGVSERAPVGVVRAALAGGRHLVLALDCPPDVAAARLAARGTRRGRLDVLDEPARRQRLAQAAPLVTRIVAALDVPVLHVDATAPPDPARVVEFIRARLPPSPTVGFSLQSGRG